MKKDDPLKSLFEKAFARESIPFDDDGWQQMESMLDRKPKPRAGFYWLFAALGISGAGLAIYLLLAASPEMAYHPRQNQADFPFLQLPGEPAVESPASRPERQRTNTGKPVTTPSATVGEETMTAAEKPPGSTSFSAEPETTEQETGSGNGNSPEPDSVPVRSTVMTTTSENTNEPQSTSDLPSPIEAPQPGSSPEGHSNDSEVIASLENTRSDSARSGLERMPIRPALPTAESSDVIEERAEGAERTERLLTPYVRASFVKSLQRPGSQLVDGWGQSIGVGAAWRLKPHFLFSVEAAFYREQMVYTRQVERSAYGFSRINEFTRFTATERLLLEVPLMIHYRSNRWTAGTGVALQYTLATRISEETGTAHHEAPAPESKEQFDRYVQWNGMRPVGLTIPVEASYLVSEHYRLGMRYRHGLSNLMEPEESPLRIAAFECFLRITLR